jgi:hypothetical protein
MYDKKKNAKRFKMIDFRRKMIKRGREGERQTHRHIERHRERERMSA